MLIKWLCQTLVINDFSTLIHLVNVPSNSLRIYIQCIFIFLYIQIIISNIPHFFRILEMQEVERAYTPPDVSSYSFDVRVETDPRLVCNSLYNS